MEFDKKIVGLEDQLLESRKKLENLTSMVQNLTDVKKTFDKKTKSNEKDGLKKLETKIDNLAKANTAKQIDTFLDNLKEELEEKHDFLNTKAMNLEELAEQISELIKTKGSQTNNQTLESIRTAIGSLDININAAISALSILDKKVKNISTNLDQPQSVEEIRDEISAVNTRFEDLHKHIDYSLTEMKGHINELSSGISSQEIKDEFGNTNSKLSQEFDNLRQDINNTNSRFEELHNHIDYSISQIRENMGQLSNGQGLKDELDSLRNEINNIHSRFSEIQDCINSSGSQFSETVGKLLSQINNNDIQGEINNTNSILSQELEGLKDEINGVNSKFAQLHQHIDYSLSQMKEHANQLSDSHELQGELGNTNAILSQEFSNLKNEINSIHNRFTELQGELNSSYNDQELKSDLNSLSNEIDSIHSRFTEIQDCINSSGSQFSETIDRLLNQTNNQELKDELNSTGSMLSQELDNIKNEINKANSRFEELHQHIDYSINQAKDQTNELSNKINSQEIKDELGQTNLILSLEFDNLKSEMSTINNKFSEIQDCINSSGSKFGETISKLLEQMDNQEFKQGIQDELGNTNLILSNQFESLKNDINSANAKFEDIHQHIDYSLSQVKENLSQISIDQELKDELENTNFMISHEFDNVKNEISTIYSRFSEIQDCINSSGSQFSETINTVLGQIDNQELKNELSNTGLMLSQELDSIKNELNTSNSRFEQLHQHIDHSINQMKENLDELYNNQGFKEDFDNLRNDINGIHNRFTEIQDCINSSGNQFSETVTRLLDQTNNQELKDELGNTSFMLSQELDNLRNDINTINSRFEEIHQHIDYSSSQNKDHTSELLSKINSQEIKDELNNANVALLQEFENLKNEINGIHNRFTELQGELNSSLQGVAAQNNNEDLRSDLNNTNSVLSQEFENLKNEISTVNSRFEELHQHIDYSLAQSKDHISELSNKIDYQDLKEDLGNTGVILVNELDSLKNDVNTVNSRFEELHQHIDYSVSQIKENMTELSGDNGLKENLDNTNSKLSQEFDALRQEINSIHNRFTEIQNCINSSGSQFGETVTRLLGQTNNQDLKDELGNTNSILSQELENLKNEINEINSRFEQLHQHIDYSVSQIKENMTELSGDNGLKENLDNTNSKLSQEFDTLRQEINSIHNRFTELQDELNSSSYSEELKNDLNNTNSILYDEFNNLKNEINGIHGRFTEIQDCINTSGSQFGDTISRLLGQINSQELKNELDNTGSMLSQELENLRHEINAANIRFEDLHKHIDYSFSQLQDNMGQLSSDNGLKDELGNATSKLYEEFDNLKNDINGIHNRFTELQSDLGSSLQGIRENITHNNNEELKNDLNNTNSMLYNEFNNLKDEIGVIHNRFTEIQNCINSSGSQFSETVSCLLNQINNQELKDDLNNVNSKLSGNLDELKNEVNGIHTRITELQNELNSSLSQIRDNVYQLSTGFSSQEFKDELGHTNSRFDHEFESLKNDISVANSKFEQLHQHIDYSLSQAKDHINELSSKISSQEIKDELGSTNSRISQEFGSVRNEINNIHSRLAEQQNQVNSSISDLQEKIGAIFGSLQTSSISSDIEKVREDVVSVNTKFAEIQNNIDLFSSEFKDNINDVLNRVSNKTVENKLDDTSAQIYNGFEILTEKVSLTNMLFGELKDSMHTATHKFKENINAVVQILETSPTTSDIEEIKDAVNMVDARFAEVQQYIDTSLNGVKENIIGLFSQINDETIRKELENTNQNLSSGFEDTQNNIVIVNTKLIKIQNEVNEALADLKGKVCAVFEVLQTSPTSSEIEDIRSQIDSTSSRLNDLQEQINFSFSRLRENINESLSLNNNKFDEIQGNLNLSLAQIEEKNSEIINVLQESDNKNAKMIADQISGLRDSIVQNLRSLHDITNSLNISPQIEELKCSAMELLSKDETGPIIELLNHLQANVRYIEELTKEDIGNKLAKIQEVLCLSHDKFNISISSSLSPLKDELSQFSDKMADIKEYLKFHSENDTNHREELAVIIERFNDIWTSAGLTIDKLANQVAITEESTSKFEDTVKNFFETSEDTNLIVSNVLKKVSSIDNNLNQASTSFDYQLENLNNNLENQSEKIRHTIHQGTTDSSNKLLSKLDGIGGKLTATIETDLNFLRADVLEFKDKQERLLEDSVSNQESIQNSLSNLHFVITDSADSISKRISELASNLGKLDESYSNNEFSNEVIKQSLVQIAQWIDGAETLLSETNSCVKDIRKNAEIRKILAELANLKETLANNTHGELRAELKSTLNALRKRQESDFNNINTNISGVSKEIFNISQAFTSFENKLRHDLKALSQIVGNKPGSKDFENRLIERFDAGLMKVKQDIGVELRKINDKFNKFESNLEDIQEKLYRLEMRQDSSGDNYEIKQMLETILQQMSSGEGGKGNALLLKKVATMERKMSDFDSNMRKIVEFIDAE